MADEPRSATQIYRAVQADQALEHVARIQALEAQVAGLQAELAQLRRGGGSDELRDLPQDALQALRRVFEAVPIPDLSAWEERQALQRLGGLLGDVDLPAGTWDPDGPHLHVTEGDGATVARTTRQVLAVLAEVAGRYLAQMIEYQGTTPDHVSRARASSLMDASSQLDAKAQFGLLPPDHQRQLFDDTVDQLIQVKDQLQTVGRWLRDGAAQTRALLARQGRKAPADAPLLGLLDVLAQAQAEAAPPLQAALAERVAGCGALLPGAELLGTLALTDTPWQRSFRGSASPEAPAAHLAAALAAVLDDHEQVTQALKPQAVTKRERQALSALAKPHAGSPARARAVLEGLRQRLEQVERAEANQAAAQKEVVKAYAAALDREARARIAAHERPEQAAAAFERLSKAETTAHLARLWSLLVDELEGLLGPDLGESQAQARAAAHTAVGSDDPQALRARRQALEAAQAALREPPTDELSLAPPIDVEAGLLARQAQELDGRVEAFMGKYSRSKRSGLTTLEAAAAALAAIDAQPKDKTAAIDALLKPSQRGTASPKREAAEAAALLEEQREVEQGEARLTDRKRRALGAAHGALAAAGLGGLPDYDAVWARVTQGLDQLDAAEAALAEVAAREARAVDVAQRLVPGQPLARPAEARALLAQLRPDAQRLQELGRALERGRDDYLEQARAALRTKKSAADFGVARDTATQATRDLRLVDALRDARQAYLLGFAQAGGPDDLGKLLTWVRRERKKAQELAAKARKAAEQIDRAAAKLGTLAVGDVGD